LNRAGGVRPVLRPTHRLIRRDLMVRRVDPWTVLKLSLVFYSSMLIIGMLANAIVWAFIARLGLIEQATEIAGALNIALTINTGNILQATFLVGVLGVIFMSSVNVFLAFLYNLVADLIGGVRIDLAEDE
jgi:site-specific recombinase